MLEDLQILNGNLELEFNKYTYEYTVTVSRDVEQLDIEYKLADDCDISIKDNKLTQKENIVYLEVTHNDESKLYTLYVYKESSNEVNGIENYRESLEVAQEPEINTLEVQALAISIFFLLVVIFSLMFHRSHKNN